MATTLNQGAELLAAFCCGLLLGGWYDLFFLLRTLLFSRASGRLRMVLDGLFDALFWLSGAVGCGMFLLLLNGLVVRFFLLLGIGLGFLAWRFSVGALVRRCFFFVRRVVRTVIDGLCRLSR